MKLFEFETKENKRLFTFYIPKEISEFSCFDGFEDNGDRVVIETKLVDFHSFNLLS